MASKSIRENVLTPSFLLFLSSLLSGATGNQAPIFINDMNQHVISENTPPGTSVYQLSGEDPERSPVKYGILGTDKLTVNPSTGDVIIAKPLDREESDILRLTVTLEDQVLGKNQDNNLVQVPISIIILDENDNPPIFDGMPFEVTVKEDAKIGTSLLNIVISDTDLVGDILSLHCKGASCDTFDLKTQESSSQTYNGTLVLKENLNYLKHPVHQLRVIASDGVHNVSTGILVQVEDVPNSPPLFRGSLGGLVKEDVLPGTLVLTVKAVDGDPGSPRPIHYELLDSASNHFLIDPETGELRTAKPLDREKLAPKLGIIHLPVAAQEVVHGIPVRSLLTETVANVTITIEDVNDEPPTFSQREYVAAIPENAPVGTPLSGLFLAVSDPDVGQHSRFLLDLEDPSGLFTLEPLTVDGSASLSIRLAKGELDYENPNQRKFILVVKAREDSTAESLSSTATVTVNTLDVNDNRPQFGKEMYMFTISEMAIPGSRVASIAARDRDSGMYGTPGLRYAIFGEGAERFSVNEKSGEVYVRACDTPGKHPCLDFETKPIYYFSFQATDAEGHGQSNVVPLKISLADSNDNPPAFEKALFRAFIEEGSTEFHPPLFIRARDPDANSDIKYSFVEESQLFSLDKNTGEIRVSNSTGLFLSENEDFTINLGIQATDGKFTAMTQANIQVKDVNNHAPIFFKPTYLETIPEKSPKGTVIDIVRASDGDRGRNAEITYHIHKGAYGDFKINSQSGEVILATDQLEYDRRATYELLILAVDSGTPALTGTATMTVNVVNRNDKPPNIHPRIQRISISENASVGDVIHRIKATDSDATDEGALRFMVAEPITALDTRGQPIQGRDTFKKFFALDEKSGEVSVRMPLDRNMGSVINIPFIVADSSADVPQTARGELVITILDINDFPPQFASPWSPSDPTIRISLEEEQPIGNPVFTFSASDPDSGISHFEISNNSVGGGYFDVDPFSGVLTVKQRLNYEKMKFINFTMNVFDSGIPQFSSSAQVFVSLINVNDEPPMFQQSPYYAEVMENAGRSTPVTVISAVDADEGEFGEFTFSLTGDHAEDFAIDERGTLTVVNSNLLDRESTPVVAVTVMAFDGLHSSTVPVYVEILDENDNPPKFQEKEYTATVGDSLSWDPPSPILQVSATDPDFGLHSALLYSIVSGNVENAFRLDAQRGVLYATRSLANLPSKYELKIRVRDENGTGPFYDEARISLEIQKTNRHAPRFLTPSPDEVVTSIPENQEAGKLIMQLRAEDRDSGSNGEVRYHLKVNETNVQETPEFSLDAENGELRSRRALDREERAAYELVLVARDNGSPLALEALHPLMVKVEDLNDNAPKFISDEPLVFTLDENAPAGTSIGEVKAEDKDIGANARIFYKILEGNEGGEFSVDEVNGVLRSQKVLDREERPSYHLIIGASNSRTFDPQRSELEEKGSSISTQEVVVRLHDCNDNAPQFPLQVNFAVIPWDAGVGYSFIQVKAIDPDKGENSSLVYNIQASLLHAIHSNDSLGSVVPSPFKIEDDGTLRTKILLTEYRGDWFTLEISATEAAHPFRQARTSIEVYLYREEDTIRLVLQEPAETVHANKDEILKELSDIAGFQLVFANLRYHVDQENNIHKNWTDMYVVGVNRKERSLAPVQKILNPIDNHYDHLHAYYENFHITSIQPVVKPLLLEGEFDPLVGVLIALLVVLIVGITSACAVFSCLRHWVPSGKTNIQEPLIRDRERPLDPLSKTENPLWLEGRARSPPLPGPYEEQELTMSVNETPPNEERISQQGDATSHAYATIQKPTRTKMIPRELEGEYATIRLPSGPVIPGLGYPHLDTIDLASFLLCPLGPEYQEMPSGFSGGPDSYSESLNYSPEGCPTLTAELL